MRDERITTWKRLLDPEAAELLRAAADIDVIDAAQIEGLRSRWPADVVTAAIALTNARRKANRKFANATSLVADVEGVEQATSETVANHKAKRFAMHGPRRILDLCCGIGGDAMSLARVAPVLAIDLDPLRAWMTRHNANCETSVDDIEALSVHGEFIHLDPARRGDAGRRYWNYRDYRPGPDCIARLVDESEAAAVKLGPGVDLDALPDPQRHEIELISEYGVLVQAVLWTGKLALHPGQRTATTLPAGDTLTGRPGVVPVSPRDEFDAYLHVPDPALERTGLAANLACELGLVSPCPPLGLLSSPHAVHSPWLTSFQVIAQMPWRPAKVKAWLNTHDAGTVEVKTRGKAVDTDTTQRELRGRGRSSFTVFALRLGKSLRAVITVRGNRPRRG